MPSSRATHIPLVVDGIVSVAPGSVLDVGCGFGKYGFLAREYGKLWCGHEPVCDAIEAWEPYIGDLQRAVYRDIFIGDALDVLPTLGTYDLAIASDILEHFTDEDAPRFLSLLLSRCKTAIVAYPVGNNPQDSIGGNDYERHQSVWEYARINALHLCQLLGEANGVEVVRIRGNGNG